MGNAQRQNQVYFDPQTNQYYTQTNPFGAYNMPKNFLTGLTQATTQNQKSPISDLLTQAMAAKANVPTLQSLFPNMGMQGMLSTPMQSTMVSPMAGQYGAGRFLGGNTMGNTGMTSNAMNTM